MEHDDRTARLLEIAVHDLAQQVHVIELAIAAIEREDGLRHAKALEPARSALANLDRGLEELAALALRVRSGRG